MKAIGIRETQMKLTLLLKDLPFAIKRYEKIVAIVASPENIKSMKGGEMQPKFKLGQKLWALYEYSIVGPMNVQSIAFNKEGLFYELDKELHEEKRLFDSFEKCKLVLKEKTEKKYKKMLEKKLEGIDKLKANRKEVNEKKV